MLKILVLHIKAIWLQTATILVRSPGHSPMRVGAIVMSCLVFLGVPVCGQEPNADTSTADHRLAIAYNRGAAEADAEIRRGEASIYTWGTTDQPLEFLDRGTGLPIKVIAGCVISEENIERAKGHDDRIRRYVAEKGPPDNSFKRWEKDLFDLKRYYEVRMETETPLRLILGRPAVKSSDGKYAVRLVRKLPELGEGLEKMCVIITVSQADHEALPVFHGKAANIDAIWGPKRSNFIVVRCEREDNSFCFIAVDLRRGKMLRASN
jgi:hypothetical protein